MSEKITPEVVAQHGLSPDTYARIQRHLGREPDLAELGVFSVMWSARHAQSLSRAHLEALPTSGPRVLKAPGEDAGLVDLGDGLAASFKVGSREAAAGAKEDGDRRGCPGWDLDVGLSGEVTAGGRWRASWRGQLAAGLPVDLPGGETPSSEHPMAPPPAHPELQRLDTSALPAPPELGAALLGLLARPGLASKVRELRRSVDADPVAGAGGPGGGAAVVRLAAPGDPHANKGVAVALGANDRWCSRDPYLGAQHVVAGCARDITCVGGEPIAVSGYLGAGDPDAPETMWQLAECVRGIGDACRVLGTPVVSSEVALRDGREGQGIVPTAIVGMVGLVEPVDGSCQGTFLHAGDVVAVIGALQGEVGGSEYLALEFGLESGLLPALDLAREKAVQETVRRAIREGLLSSAHACAGGGLAVALAACCLRRDGPAGEPAPGIGATVRVPFPARKDFVLFGEDASRIVVSFANASTQRLLDLARECGAPVVRLGVVGGDRLVIEGALDVPVAALAEAWGEGRPGGLRGDAANGPLSNTP